MNDILDIVEKKNDINVIVKETYYGYVLTTVLIVILVIRAVIINQGMDYVNEGVTATYASLYTSLYKRLLYLIESSKGIIGAGRIINFFTTDSTFTAETLQILNNLWIAPIHLIASVIMMYQHVEWCAFICVGMILIMCIVQSLVMNAFTRNKFANQRETDKRTKLLQEYLEGIRIIKYYAWERFVYGRVESVRRAELKQMAIALRLRTLYEFIATFLPVLTMLTVFGVYVATIGDLTVSKVFTVISLFRILRNPLWMFASAAIQITQTKASLMRISHFFKLTESSQSLQSCEDPMFPIGKLSIENGTFAWETSETKKACEQFSKYLNARFGSGKKGAPGEGDKKKLDSETGEKTLEKIKDKSQEEKDNYITLRDINITIEPGTIVGIVGLVGSGKTSLSNAMIGEMLKLSGSVKFNGKLAYIAQNAWIMNGTLRENIIMNNPFDEQKYNHTLRICELTEDLISFAKADLTEVGSKGINLSGGQKQRIAIARAVYADADIYVIDDCLSALDPHVAKCIFHNVILDALNGKTRIFVTHGMSYLKEFKHIYVLKNGRIIAHGSYTVLKETNEEFKYLTILDKEKKKKEEEEKNNQEKELEKNNDIEDKKNEELLKAGREGKGNENLGKLTLAEKQEAGRIKWKNYVLLFKYPGIFISMCCIFAFCVEEAVSVLIDWWVGIWSDDEYDKSDTFYIVIYGVFCVSLSLIVVIRSFLYISFIMGLARNTQMTLFWTILRAPLQWFDRTPVGRIMNRACNDQSNIDADLVWLVKTTLMTLLQILGSVVLVSILLYYFLIVVGVSAFLYWYYLSFSIQAARDARRIESNSKSPIFVQYEETLDGLSTIRAYKYQEMFNDRIIKKVNHCMNSYFMATKCVRWLNMRADIVSGIVVGGAFYLCVWKLNDEPDKSATIGLALSQSLNVIYAIPMFLLFYGMMDTRMNAIERIYEYITTTPHEKDFDEPKSKDPTWPQEGEVKLNHLHLRYRNDLPFVIKDLNLKIPPREKIGVVGRTGSGKSTLTLGLLRIMEPVDPSIQIPEEAQRDPAKYAEMILEPIKDAIVIDGEDITKFGLHVVRKNIAIIPQDPILFSGNIKNNLDPFSEGNTERDDEMIAVLKKVKLLEKIWMKVVGERIKMVESTKSEEKKTGPEIRLEPIRKEHETDANLLDVKVNLEPNEINSVRNLLTPEL
jgi:ABC-type multidrug transport system fused ATPase/permease subunit